MENPFRYFQHIRHMKPAQYVARLRQKVRPPRLPGALPAPRWRGPASGWVRSAVMPHRILDDHRFLIMGQERALNLPGDWNNRELGRKWLMELHAFHVLAGDSGEPGRSLITSWLAAAETGTGPGWHPYMTSNRIDNWLKWGLSGHVLDEWMRASLARQVRFLRQALLYDELDHKLLNNGKVLWFAGHCLDDPEADRWRTTGRALIDRYLTRLVGADGGYRGLSPMYHSALLKDLLDLYNLHRALGEPPPGALVDTLGRARRWLQAMSHPDGQIALFNDAAFEVVASPSELEAYAGRLDLAPMPVIGDGLLELRDSGFARLQLGPAMLLADVGPIGMDHSPGHGHADTLSFELSLHSRRLLVDTGISTYERMPDRLRERETRAHNTLVLDGRNSSDVWSHYKVGRRARVSDLETRAEPERLVVAATHDGFRLFANPLRHHREWALTPGTLTIRDQVTGHGQHRVEIVFHFHPAVKLEQLAEHRLQLSFEQSAGVALLELDPRMAVETSRYAYHPAFDRSEPAWQVVAALQGSLPLQVTSRLSWGEAG
jgi:uncharacterized heparinase superfamily protein